MEWCNGRPPKWIAFDAVGTLIFADPPVHLAYYRIGRKHGSQARPEEILHRFRAALARRAAETPLDVAVAEAGQVAPRPRRQWERQFWRGVVDEVLPDAADRDGCFEELFAHFAQPTAWQCFADVDEAFEEALRRECRLAIASNFDARLHAVCDGLEPLRNLERRVISSEVGARKPQPEFYQALLEACGCTAEELVFVGDDPENDVVAPRELGIRSVHLDRSGAAQSAIQSLADLWAG